MTRVEVMFMLQGVYCCVTISSEGARSTAEAIRGFAGKSERHFVGRVKLGTSCIRPAHSAIQSVLESATSRGNLLSDICVGEASDNPTGKEMKIHYLFNLCFHEIKLPVPLLHH